MKRILVSAYAISPVRGSECAVGWEITTRLGEFFDVTVLTCEETPSNTPYYKEIENYIANHGNIKNVHFVPVKMPKNSKKYTKMHDLGFWPAYYWGYNCWQKEAYKVAKDLHKQKRFDMAYQLNMIGFREPGYLWRLDIPFLWGPTNGFHSIPFSFIRGYKGKSFLVQLLKHLANEVQIKLSFRAKKAAKKASIVWCVDETAVKNMKQWNANAELMQETGLNQLPDKFVLNRHYDGIRCLNLVWSGMITPGKALNILIKALLELKNFNFHLTVIGDGPLLNHEKKQAEAIQNKITWTGWLKKADAIESVKKADLLIHTSLKEGTPHSILEALGMGVPVLCHDTCGMGAVVNTKNGFKMPYKNVETSVEFIVNLLQSIQHKPDVLNNLYESIWETTNDLTWESKVNTISKKITELLN
jgi:glycosyltransferase involved in cell wall biosynthesis